MAILDTTGVYSVGDDYRTIKALGLSFGDYVLGCVSGCMNDLEGMSVVAATDLVSLLGAYETADAAESASMLDQASGGKVLTKADVLEWEVLNGGISGASVEKAKVRGEIRNLLAFCFCLNGVAGEQYGTMLVRS